MKEKISSLCRKSIVVLFFVLVTMFLGISAHAAAVLEVEPITWDVIGLDSNDVSAGPNHYPVGVRICNTGDTAATNVEATYVWDSANAFINLRPGTLTVINIDADGNPLSIAAGDCFDAYFEVELTRNASAYDTTREYHIAVTADGDISVSSPTPREIYIEHLISQSRNYVDDLKLDGVSIPAGGTMDLVVGNTYNITVNASTATQGYNQLEAFVTMPNTIFQVLNVNTTYTADSSPLVDNPNDKLYADACGWENDPNSPNYRSCVEGDGKAGGTIETTYTVKILQVPGAPLVNPEPLSTLIHDFSGSSFHYNSDYDVTTRFAMIYGPSSITIDKSFVPKVIAANGTSVMTVTITNPTPEAVTGINFSDGFPTGMTVDGTPGVTISGLGASAFLSSTIPAKTALVGGETTVYFLDGELAAYSSATIQVNVTADDTAASYLNTTNNLFIDTSVDTGNSASDTLYISIDPLPPANCGGPVSMATWTMPPSTTTPPVYTTLDPDMIGAVASYNANGYAGGADSIISLDATDSAWAGTWPLVPNSANTPDPTLSGVPYFEFTLTYDPNKYNGVSMSFWVYLADGGDWGNANANTVYVYKNDGSGWSYAATGTPVKKGTWTQVTVAGSDFPSGATQTTYRLSASGSTKTSGARVILDDIEFTGCVALDPPTIVKSFLPDPIAEGGTSTLTFTITNPNTGDDLTGIEFTDNLPAGLVVATPNGLTGGCGSGTITATAGSGTVSLSGATLTGGSSCTFSVDITGAVAGNYTNVSENISAVESGTNTTSSGYATDTLTVVAPPEFLKSFSPASVYTFGTSTLTFEITNPNTTTDLTGVSFTDTLPAGLVVNTPNGLTGGCGSGTITATAGSGTISLSAATLAAGATCTFSVTVYAMTSGTKNNSTFVSSTEGGNSNTSSASLVVVDQIASIDLTKQISADSASGPWYKYTGVPSGDDVWYRFKVYNSGDLQFTSLNVVDDQFTPSCTWNPALPLLPGDETFCVYGPVTASQVSLVNTAYVVGTYAFGTERSGNSSAEYASAELTLTKTASESYYAAEGDVLHYTYVVQNTGAASLEGPVTLLDDLSSDETCPDLSTIGDFDNFLDPGESITCTATYTVVAGDVGVGNSVTNTAFATVQGVTSNTDSATVPWRDLDLTVTKTNDAGGSSPIGTPFTWTLTIGNDGEVGAVFTDTQVIMRDPLPMGATYSNLSAGNFTNIANSGNIACAIDGSNVLTCTSSGGPVTIGPGGSFTVSFDATPTVYGTLPNTATVDPNDEISESDETNNTGSDTVNVPTLALISEFTAYDDGGKVVVAWKTGFEQNTIGFNLECVDEKSGKFKKINKKLLPGLINSLEGGIYRYVDKSARAGEAKIYKLVEVESDGDKNVYGPYTITVLANPPEGYSSDIMTGEYKATPKEPSDENKALREAAKMEKKSARVAKEKRKGISAKIAIREEGVYWLKTSQIADVFGESRKNVEKWITQGKLSLTHMGEDVAWTVPADNDGILFYGVGSTSQYTDQNIYWLSNGKGVQIETQKGSGPRLDTENETPDTYTTTIHLEEDLQPFMTEIHNPHADYWMWEYLFAGFPGWDQKSYTINAEAAASGNMPVTLIARFKGAMDAMHHAQVSINGVVLGSAEWSSFSEKSLRLEFDQSLLLDGENEIQVKAILNNGLAYDVFYVNDFDLTYQRYYQTADNQLEVIGDGNPVVTVKGYADSDISVFDITDVYRPKKLAGVTIDSVEGAYCAGFSPLKPETPYFVFSDIALRPVEEMIADVASSLKSVKNRADYLVIAPFQLLEGAKALAELRHDYSTMVVDLEDVYDEFSAGIETPYAIRDFLGYAFSKWQQKPRYVVLVGDGSYDYKDNLDKEDNLIPALMTDTRDGLMPSDDIFADVVGNDRIPDIAIGRIPAVTNSEVISYLDKIRAYERSFGEWRNRVMLLADNADHAGDFPSDSDAVAGLLPAGVSVEKMYLSDYPIGIVRQAIIDGINTGAGVVNYIGHGGADRLASEGMLKKDDVSILSNDLMPPVLSAMTCSVGTFSIPGYDGLGEALVVAENKGFAAVWSASGMSYNSEAVILDMEFIKAFYREDILTIGDAIKHAKAGYSKTGNLLETINYYILIGDPALRIK